MKLLATRLRAHFASQLTSQQCIDLEDIHGCHNYSSLPVVIDRAQGIYAYDCENKKYLDFLSAYSAVNQGHIHPKILETFLSQSQKLTLTSRAVYNSSLGKAEKYLNEVFGYQKTLFMNTGVEGGESAVKIARRWGYVQKGVQDNKATVLFAKGNFWGRTIAACASSDDPERFIQFGPFGNLNFRLIDYGSEQALEKELKNDPTIVGFMVEPIQGQKGVIIPPKGYLKRAHELCQKYNALLICDEVQTGLGRTGKLLCSDHQLVKPDILILGKSLSGGFLPISAVLCNNYIMNNIKPGQHGSTYGGSPLAAEVAIRSLQVTLEQKMSENSLIMGQYLLEELRKILVSNRIKEIRGKGLFIGAEFEEGDIAYKFSKLLIKHGLIAKPTQQNIIRFSPPLIITKAQVDEGLGIIEKSWQELKRNF